MSIARSVRRNLEALVSDNRLCGSGSTVVTNGGARPYRPNQAVHSKVSFISR